MKRLMLAVLVAASACAGAPAFADDAPPCGTKDGPVWCASLDTGAVTVVTRGERHEYATGAIQVKGPLAHTGLQLFLRAELYGVQDGGRLNFGDPQSFRAVVPAVRLSKAVGAFDVSAIGSVTLSVEGQVGAPVDPRLYTAQLEASGRLKGVLVRARGGHDGTAGGWALGGGVEIPIPGAPSIVSDYSYPLTRPANPLRPLPWVVTAGARISFGTWGLADLFGGK